MHDSMSTLSMKWCDFVDSISNNPNCVYRLTKRYASNATIKLMTVFEKFLVPENDKFVPWSQPPTIPAEC